MILLSTVHAAIATLTMLIISISTLSIVSSSISDAGLITLGNVDLGYIISYPPSLFIINNQLPIKVINLVASNPGIEPSELVFHIVHILVKAFDSNMRRSPDGNQPTRDAKASFIKCILHAFCLSDDGVHQTYIHIPLLVWEARRN